MWVEIHVFRLKTTIKPLKMTKNAYKIKFSKLPKISDFGHIWPDSEGQSDGQNRPEKLKNRPKNMKNILFIIRKPCFIPKNHHKTPKNYLEYGENRILKKGKKWTVLPIFWTPEFDFLNVGQSSSCLNQRISIPRSKSSLSSEGRNSPIFPPSGIGNRRRSSLIFDNQVIYKTTFRNT